MENNRNDCYLRDFNGGDTTSAGARADYNKQNRTYLKLSKFPVTDTSTKFIKIAGTDFRGVDVGKHEYPMSPADCEQKCMDAGPRCHFAVHRVGGCYLKKNYGGGVYTADPTNTVLWKPEGVMRAQLGQAAGRQCNWADEGCRQTCGSDASCEPLWKAYCSSGDRIAKDGLCNDLGDQRFPVAKRDLRLAWCAQGNNFDTDFCKAVCDAKGEKQPGEIDQQLKATCNQIYKGKCVQPSNATKDICCSFQPLEKYDPDVWKVVKNQPISGKEPVCIADKCIGKGYYDMHRPSKACPTETCINLIESTISGNAQPNNNTFAQVCSSDAAAAGEGAEGGGANMLPLVALVAALGVGGMCMCLSSSLMLM